jgi:hypothetical protein
VMLSGTTGEIDWRRDVSASVVWVKSRKGRVAPDAELCGRRRGGTKVLVLGIRVLKYDYCLFVNM